MIGRLHNEAFINLKFEKNGFSISFPFHQQGTSIAPISFPINSPSVLESL